MTKSNPAYSPPYSSFCQVKSLKNRESYLLSTVIFLSMERAFVVDLPAEWRTGEWRSLFTHNVRIRKSLLTGRSRYLFSSIVHGSLVIKFFMELQQRQEGKTQKMDLSVEKKTLYDPKIKRSTFVLSFFLFFCQKKKNCIRSVLQRSSWT